MIYEITANKEKCIPLFAGQTDSVIYACLQGFHGNVWADNADDPHSARIICGDFCFFGGDAALPEAEELVKNLSLSPKQELMIFIPATAEWTTLLQKVYGEALTVSPRYATKKEPHVFSLENLQNIINTLPEGFSVKQIDRELYEQLLSEGWSKDFVFNFKNADDFVENGLGFVILKGEKIVSGASSYTRCEGGIEIEIATHPDYRKQGLASVCGAKLVLACEEKGLYPYWDAANLTSVKLSQKLGYHFSHEYPSYHLSISL